MHVFSTNCVVVFGKYFVPKWKNAFWTGSTGSKIFYCQKETYYLGTYLHSTQMAQNASKDKAGKAITTLLLVLVLLAIESTWILSYIREATYLMKCQKRTVYSAYINIGKEIGKVVEKRGEQEESRRG